MAGNFKTDFSARGFLHGGNEDRARYRSGRCGNRARLRENPFQRMAHQRVRGEALRSRHSHEPGLFPRPERQTDGHGMPHVRHASTRAPKCIRIVRMQHFDRITWNPNQMNGQPCIRGMRLTVRRVVEAVALYPNRDDLFHNYPELEPDDVRQALAFAAANLEDSAAESHAA